MVYKGLKYALRNTAVKDIQKCFNVRNIQKIMPIFGKSVRLLVLFCIGLMLNEKITRLIYKPYIIQESYLSKSFLEILTEGLYKTLKIISKLYKLIYLNRKNELF